MDTIAVIYRPELLKFHGPFGFSCPRPRPKTKDTLNKIELMHIWLTPGVNFLSLSEQWEQLLAHPTNKANIDNLMRKGAILVKKPELLEGAIATNTTVDFSDLDDVRDLIYHANDVEWLRRCIAKDNRPQVDRWCYERIEEIEEIKKRLAQSVDRVA